MIFEDMDVSEKTLLGFYPILPLKDSVVFPGIITPLFVGRDKSIMAVNKALERDKHIVLLLQKESLIDAVGIDNLFSVGVLAEILQNNELPDGGMKVLVNAVSRVLVNTVQEANGFLETKIEIIQEKEESPEIISLFRKNIVNDFMQYANINKKISSEVISFIEHIPNDSKFVDKIATHLEIPLLKKQKVLESIDIIDRMDLISMYIAEEIKIVNMDKVIRSRVQRQMEKTQREYYLNEQIKAIQRELGVSNSSPEKAELDEIEKKIHSVQLSKEAKEKALSELKKLNFMNQMSAEAGVLRGYLEWMLSVPWKNRTQTKSNLNVAKDILDKNHYGIEEAKERILECLAVQGRIKHNKGAVICFVGPPGVGKTSLARSVAKATGRKFAQISLGGVKDESEIRGHRKTYIGSLPGKIIQGMKKAGSSNPLFLLDEIDKMSSDFRGDPSSALLEVLDFEHNHAFVDHYLEVDYDLSEVMFLATANSLSTLPYPLLDRMEIINIASYTEAEKMHIAVEHLIPKQQKLNGLNNAELTISNDAISLLIRRYTREAGVRSLERELSKIARKTLKKIVSDKNVESIYISNDNLSNFSGPMKYVYGTVNTKSLVGVVNGLAYTEVGGDLLTIEAIAMHGKGRLSCTGKLGDVMKESAQVAFNYALSYLTSRYDDVLGKRDIHIHVPEGATPKDGPSAGIAICSVVLSLLLNTPAKRNVAMTGEITLTGRVLPIGGLKEKLLGAIRGGIEKVIIPHDNEQSLVKMPAEILDSLTIVTASSMDDVLQHVFEHKIKWENIINKPLPISDNFITEITSSVS
ncbi:Lon protease [Candidatus Xenohaliotis californiensis]|uniref:Lon protease n=1 Tax=Candidatus Xenohaliotis californiensis TaxID=84677 RepID=A0ABP0EUD3_9RICK|nr:Lon protease [Candidatus Xenohaliotis californiensis]